MSKQFWWSSTRRTTDNLQILRDLLGSVGYEIIEARDGAGGVKAAKTERPDLF
jgi:two-component system cell cycle response regulator DivK